MIAAVRCAPPDNKPTTIERDTCAPWLSAEIGAVLSGLRVVLTLGGYAWAAAVRTLGELGAPIPRPRPRFGHASEVPLGAGRTLLGCYHPSQHNTFTGRLTPEMLDAVFTRAHQLADP